jgi:energy-coupling factor transport system ATP-binding protein
MRPLRTVVLSEGVCVADSEPYKILTDDEIIKKASLKRTRLYELALNTKLANPQGFVGKYIRFDRKMREQKRAEYDK